MRLNEEAVDVQGQDQLQAREWSDLKEFTLYRIEGRLGEERKAQLASSQKGGGREDC